MPNDSRIGQMVQEILTGSGVPADRREEVADEMRAHLEQLADAKRQQGLPEHAAVQAAIHDFGNPVRIRRRLRDQAAGVHRREALSGIRKRLPVLLTGCSFPVGYVVVATFLSLGANLAALAWALATGSVMYASLLLALVVMMYPFASLRVRLLHPLPSSDNHLLQSIGVRFLAVYTALFGCHLIAAAGVLAGFFIILCGCPGRQDVLCVDFATNFAKGFLPFAIRGFAVVALLAAAVMAGIEYRRCPASGPALEADR